jgi:allantoicase
VGRRVLPPPGVAGPGLVLAAGVPAVSDLVFVRVHVDGSEVWVNARRILSIWPDGGRARLHLNYGPPIVTQEDPDEILDMLRRAGDGELV